MAGNASAQRRLADSGIGLRSEAQAPGLAPEPAGEDYNAFIDSIISDQHNFFENTGVSIILLLIAALLLVGSPCLAFLIWRICCHRPKALQPMVDAPMAQLQKQPAPKDAIQVESSAPDSQRGSAAATAAGRNSNGARSVGSKSTVSGNNPGPLKTVTYDTLDDMTMPLLPTLTPPVPGASHEQRMEYLAQQIDSMIGSTICQGLVLKDGPSNRLQGGQAIVQFAGHQFNKLEFAVKFFLYADSFKQELAQYADCASPMHAFLPSVHAVVENSNEEFKDGHGYPLPSCIVMERGESLDLWMKRSKHGLDMYTCMQIIQHVSDCLVDLHAAGYAHRDLKPANIMWLPSTNRWTLIDFGCAAAQGEPARIAFSLLYAAPEIVTARFREDRKTVKVDAAVDVWALGVIAVELFSGRPVFEPLLGKDKVIQLLCDKKDLPWEDPARAGALLTAAGHYSAPILSLLKYDPSNRPGVSEFLAACASLTRSTAADEAA